MRYVIIIMAITYAVVLLLTGMAVYQLLDVKDFQ